MGYFAVVSEQQTQQFAIVECHLNLWSYKGILGRDLFAFDVGLRIKALTQDGVSEILLAVPFGTESDGLEDLFNHMNDQKIASMIFARQVNLNKEIIEYKSRSGTIQRFKLARVPQTEASQVELKCGQDFSVWKLKITPPITPDDDGYIRVRFNVSNVDRVWTWKRVAISRAGALVDFRIADSRETANVPKWDGFQNQLVSIEKLNLFVIASSAFQQQAASPPIHSMRLLEGEIWERYLGRRIRGRKLVIYQWRHEAVPPSVQTPDAISAPSAFLSSSSAMQSNTVSKPKRGGSRAGRGAGGTGLSIQPASALQPTTVQPAPAPTAPHPPGMSVPSISATAPFRAFLNLTREFGVHSVWNHLFAGISMFAVVMLAFGSLPYVGGVAKSVLAIKAHIVGLGAFAIATAAVSYFEASKKMLGWTAKYFRKVEKWCCAIGVSKP